MRYRATKCTKLALSALKYVSQTVLAIPPFWTLALTHLWTLVDTLRPPCPASSVFGCFPAVSNYQYTMLYGTEGGGRGRTVYFDFWPSPPPLVPYGLCTPMSH